MDIKGSLKGPVGKLSNFTARIFIFDGIPCACLEGLLQSFKFDNPEVQKVICMLDGKAAKTIGQVRNDIWQSRQMLWWRGIEYPRHSQAFQMLLDRVYETVSQLRGFQTDLLATGDEVLTHSIGTQDPSKTVLTEEEFCSRLMKIRGKLREGPKHLTLEEMNLAAIMIEGDGEDAFYAVAERFGKEVAQILFIAHLRRRMGSTDTFPAKPEISAEAIKRVRGM